MDLFLELGLWGLGLSAFLAATILPISSEIILTSLLMSGESPVVLLLIATAANVTGSVVNYVVGRWGSDTILHNWLHITPLQTDKAEQQFNRYGKWSLLFSWLPVIGDPLTFIAGVLKINFVTFLVLVTIGKFSRYWIISQAVLTGSTI
jgi:membrane protein YqaA with SNARE-associated domain